MIYLLLSIFCTTVIYILFQLFQRFKVDLFPALIANYFTCTAVAPLFAAEPYPTYLAHLPQDLFAFGILLGCSFISVFYLMSSATQLLGVAGGTIVSRMSMIIPAGFAVIFFHEPVTILKIVGLVLALSAIYFTVGLDTKNKTGNHITLSKKMLWLPVAAFFGVGLVDTLLKISQVKFFGNKADSNFVGFTYFWAFVAGLVILLLLRRKEIPLLFKSKNLGWGFMLGIANYFSISLFYKALTTPNLHASTIFPINSVGIVALSSLAAIIFLKEKLSIFKAIGLSLAIAAIILLSWETFVY